MSTITKIKGRTSSISTPCWIRHDCVQRQSLRTLQRIQHPMYAHTRCALRRSFTLRSKVECYLEEENIDTQEDHIVSAIAADTDTIAVTKSSMYEEEFDYSNSSQSNADELQFIDPSFTPILALCFLVTLLSALDRVAMSIAILPISAEYAFSETIKGNIASAVSYGYGLAILPIGLAVSVVSSRALMMAGVALWSVATMATPAMVEWSTAGGGIFLFPLLAVRAIMGAAEAVVLPTMQRILANWVPPERKASILGTIVAGFQVGTLSAYVVSPVVMDAMSGIDGGPEGADGWRGLFYVYGIAGLLWMVPWWLLAKDAPNDTTRMKEDAECQETLVNTMVDDDASLVLFEECYVEGSVELATKRNENTNVFDGIKPLLQSAPWMAFLTSKGVWAMTIAHAAKNWELYNLLAWTPTFFSEQYGLNIKESALFSVVPSVCGMVGGLTAGNVADYVLGKLEHDETDEDGKIKKRTQVRKVVQSIALLGPAICLYFLSNLPDQPTTAQILLGGTVGLQAFDAAGFGAATQDKAGKRWSGLLYSFTSLPGVMIGSLSVSVTGKILDALPEDNGWAIVFQLNAAICVVGALSFLILYDSKKEFE